MERRKRAAAVTGADPAGVGMAAALLRLRPDLEAGIMAGTIDFDDVMPDLNRAFVDRLFQVVAMRLDGADGKT
ncbi:hypothetical protein [Mesorhizobium sp. LNJC391B00]|uniref:hypothetical protein n=1 Tax=Mesorhizobium sp. LNJC391B00 TaxID=1287273 RepID=UPI0003CF95E1|nr:hypothetical protein [Mesorhizobium sp. LNJC391B00]ESY20392.1 hypothetical protein X749_29535 [Mesorhizobium sp. LNJC391B00]